MRLYQHHNSLIKMTQGESDDYAIKSFHVVDKSCSLICKKGKIMIVK